MYRDPGSLKEEAEAAATVEYDEVSEKVFDDVVRWEYEKQLAVNRVARSHKPWLRILERREQQRQARLLRTRVKRGWARLTDSRDVMPRSHKLRPTGRTLTGPLWSRGQSRFEG